jgi:hypothetical protein
VYILRKGGVAGSRAIQILFDPCMLYRLSMIHGELQVCLNSTLFSPCVLILHPAVFWIHRAKWSSCIRTRMDSVVKGVVPAEYLIWSTSTTPRTKKAEIQWLPVFDCVQIRGVLLQAFEGDYLLPCLAQSSPSTPYEESHSSVRITTNIWNNRIQQDYTIGLLCKDQGCQASWKAALSREKGYKLRRN